MISPTIQKGLVVLLTLFCFSTFADKNPFRKAENALLNGDLLKAHQELELAKDESDCRFWKINTELAIEISKSTIYAYENLIDNPLIFAYSSYKKADSLCNESLLNETEELLENALYQKSAILYNKQKHTEALPYYKTLLDLAPSDTYYKYAGINAKNANEPIQAKHYFLKCIQLKRQDISVYQQLNNTLIITDSVNYQLRDSVISISLFNYPEQIDFLLLKTEILSLNKEENESDQIENIYIQIIDLEQNNFTANYNLAVMYYNQAILLLKSKHKEESNNRIDKALQIIQTYQLNQTNKYIDTFNELENKLILLQRL